MTEKVALITGGARRIGKEIARYLHRNGMNVIIHHKTSVTEAEALVQELNQLRKNSARALTADLSQEDLCEKLIQDSYQTWQRLDALINNASQFYPTPVSAVTHEQWQDLMNNNVKGPYFLSIFAAPFLRQQQGTIINIADIHGIKPLKNYSIYSISKAALIMLTQSLAKEFAPDVRVNAIAPGAILWPEQENELSKLKQQDIIKKTLLKRQGNPEDIAKAVWFFINDAAYVTGQTLPVDGGRFL